MEPLDRYTDAVVDHVRRPRNAGPLRPADAQADARNPACGDLVRIYLRVTEGAVTAAGFQAEGCPATVACASRLTEVLAGLPVDGLEDLDPDALAADLGGLPPDRFHAAEVACRAARLAGRALEAT